MKPWLRPSPEKLLILLVVIFFFALLGWPINLLYPPGSDYSDLMLTHWPNAFFFRQSVWRDGTWPLWNPNQFLGAPFAANPLSGLWYPPNLLFLLLPVTPAFNFLLVLHLCFAGMGMMRLLRRGLGDGIPAAAGAMVAGLAWALTPKLWAHLGAGHVGLVYAAAWLPWVAEAALQLITKPFPFTHFQLALTWALQFLADPRLAAYMAVGLAAVALWWAWGQRMQDEPRPARSPIWRWRGMRVNIPRWRGYRLRFIGPWVAAGLMGVALTAVQWLPLLDYLPYTNRSEITVGQSAVDSLPWSKLLNLLWAQPGGFHEWVTYVGIGVLVLGLIGWLTLPGRWRWGVALAIAGLALFAVGDNGPLYPLLARLPGATLLRVPPRAWFLFSFVAAGLAGLGTAELARQGDTVSRHKRALNRVAVASLSAAGVMAVGTLLVSEMRSLWSIMAFAFFWLWLGVAAVVAARRGRWPGWLVSALWVLLVAAELVWMDSSLVVRRPASQLFADGRETAGYLSQHANGRVYAPSFRPATQVAMVNSVRIVNGVEPLQPADYRAVLQAAAGFSGNMGYSVTLPALPSMANAGSEVDVGDALADSAPHPWLLGLLDVEMIVAQFPLHSPWLNQLFWYERENLYVYRNRAVSNWPAVFQKVERVPDLESALKHLGNVTLASRAVVVDGEELNGPSGAVPAEQSELNPNHVRVRAAGPGLLVLSELYLPGWKAWIDGEPAEIVPANGILRGIYLAAGDHVVDMVYRPWSVTAGAFISVIGLLVVLVGLVWSRFREV